MYRSDLVNSRHFHVGIMDRFKVKTYDYIARISHNIHSDLMRCLFYKHSE